VAERRAKDVSSQCGKLTNDIQKKTVKRKLITIGGTEMKKVKALALFSIIYLVAAVILVLPITAEAASKEIKAVTFQIKTSKLTESFLMFVNLVNERAKGELTIKYLGGPEVIPPPDQPLAVKTGAMNMAMTLSAFYAGLVPEALTLALSKVGGPGERQVGYDKLLDEYHRKAGLVYLGRPDPKADPKLLFLFLRDKPAKKPQDLKGLVISSAAPNVVAFLPEFGASPKVIQLHEAYTALERGETRGQSVPLKECVDFGIYKGVKYVIDHPYWISFASIIINGDTWKGLTNSQQELLRNCLIELEPKLIRFHQEEAISNRKTIMDSGIKFIQFSPEDAKLFVDTAYRFEAKRIMGITPNAEKLLKMIGALD
jgi:TRAP-type C4-dicarboxylate transport system substrate-binding protein